MPTERERKIIELATLYELRLQIAEDEKSEYSKEEILALLDQKEMAYDIAVAEEAYAEYVSSGRKSRPISELWKELDL